MSLLKSLKMYARYAAGLPGFLRNQIDAEQAKAIIAKGMAEREQNFLKLMGKGVYGHPESPYAKLLKLAQCEFGDLKDSVERNGLTATLRQLRSDGVYISFEEFKGREPIVRNGQTIEVSSSDFQNPYVRLSYESTSGGSTGAGTRVGHDLEHLHFQAAHQLMLLRAHGLENLPIVVWRGILPDSSGLNNMLRHSHCKHAPARWFSPNDKDEAPPPFRFQVGTYGTVLVSRLVGRPIPWPEMVPIRDGIVVAKCLADMIQKHGGVVFNTAVSRGLRVAVAAREAGISLKGAYFQVAGEPPSPAKVEGILASGAKHLTNYGFTEGGRVAIGCAKPNSFNDLHIVRDGFEVLPHERLVPGTDQKVSALNLTSLFLTSPQILLNTELDDYGVVEERNCGCSLHDLGYHVHVRDIHSYRKLTGEGVTLIGSDMVDIMERLLPQKFGGSALDYQLAEQEDEQGFTRLCLLIHPRLDVPGENEIVKVILDHLEATSLMASRAQAIWRQANSLRIIRKEPVWTGRGKLMPLHLASKREKIGQ